MELPRYILLEKAVGETPLQRMEAWRTQAGIAAHVPLTYAGRLDPMASGQLLVLVGEECKKKDKYLALDKTYQFSVLLGIGSDTHDVLGLLQTDPPLQTDTPSLRALGAARPRFTLQESTSVIEAGPGEELDQLREVVRLGLASRSAAEGSWSDSELYKQLQDICQNLAGDIKLPYPHFSSKTVAGKPLFQWALEDRLDEIEIPTKASTIYSLELNKTETLLKTEVCDQARTKIDTIPEVTDEHKRLGNDFRRVDIRQDWENLKHDDSQPDQYVIAHFTCHCSSGTYMRTLAKIIGEQLDPAVPSLAWSIDRTEIKL